MTDQEKYADLLLDVLSLRGEQLPTKPQSDGK